MARFIRFNIFEMAPFIAEIPELGELASFAPKVLICLGYPT
jgi:hypothetical protein